MQSFWQESFSNQKSGSFTFFCWILLLKNHGSLQELTFLSIIMLIFLWLFLLRDHTDHLSVSKPMRNQWPKYVSNLFSCKTSVFLLLFAVKVLAFPPLSMSETSCLLLRSVLELVPDPNLAGGWQLLLWHTEPSSASRLKPSETKNKDTSAEGQGVNFLWPAEGLFWIFFKEHTPCMFQSLDDTRSLHQLKLRKWPELQAACQKEKSIKLWYFAKMR